MLFQEFIFLCTDDYVLFVIMSSVKCVSKVFWIGVVRDNMSTDCDVQ